MAFLLNRSGKQMLRLSSSWATPSPLRLLTSVNNCFSSTATSSPGGVNQRSNPKDFDAALKGGMIQESNQKDVAALTDMLVTGNEYFAKNLVNAIQNKPLPSEADFHKFVDDLFEKLPPVDSETKDSSSETDQAEENPKATTPEMIKASSEFADALSGGLFINLPKPAYKAEGDNFNFTRDTNGLYLTMNVPGLKKEQLVVWVVRDQVLVSSTSDVEPEAKVGVAITMPDDHNYDVDEVTGTIMEDGQLKISFPVSKEGGEPKEKYFEVNLI